MIKVGQSLAASQLAAYEIDISLIKLISSGLVDHPAEGVLNAIALPHNRCNYGAVIDAFKAKYGLTVNEITGCRFRR